MRVLFVCSRNRLRSPTAEHVFAGRPGVEVASAGLSRTAITPLTPELVIWADLIFVMERSQQTRLRAQYRRHLGDRRVVCLDIPDEFAYLDPGLVRLLEARVTPFLPPE